MKKNRKKIDEAIEDALSKRDIEELRKDIEEGFRGVHNRQDMTNGKVLRAGQDIIELKGAQSFYKGALAVLTAIVIPLALLLLKFLLDKGR